MDRVHPAQGAGSRRRLSMTGTRRYPSTMSPKPATTVSANPASPASPNRPLKVGIQLPEVEREVRWLELLDMTRAIEDLGFDSIWLGEHLLYRWEDRPPRGPWEAWSMLAAIAAVTSRVEFGPLVACTNFHNPALLAKQAATIDEVSGGRLILGLGAGWNETEFRAYGFPYDHRVERFEEAFTIIRTLLDEGAIDFDGRWYQARDCELLPRGPRPGGLPLMIGSNGPRMLRTTLPHVDAWNSWFAQIGNRPQGVGPLRDLIDATCREVNRDPAEVERTVAVLVRLPGATGRLQGDYAADPAPPLEGSPAEMAEVLREFSREGIGHVQLVVDPITLASIQALGPLLAELDRT
jgi:alkanesulfonate monooxygenase SsuD/methylene tetrahydromethanopterin reductase-like flavin-dependent oxidoreductase (luciferase family)